MCVFLLIPGARFRPYSHGVLVCKPMQRVSLDRLHCNRYIDPHRCMLGDALQPPTCGSHAGKRSPQYGCTQQQACVNKALGFVHKCVWGGGWGVAVNQDILLSLNRLPKHQHIMAKCKQHVALHGQCHCLTRLIQFSTGAHQNYVHCMRLCCGRTGIIGVNQPPVNTSKK